MAINYNSLEYFNSNEQIWPLQIVSRDSSTPEGTLITIAGGFDVPLLLIAMTNPKYVYAVDVDPNQLEFAKRKLALINVSFEQYAKTFLEVEHAELNESTLKILTKIFPNLPQFIKKRDQKKIGYLRGQYATLFNYYGSSPTKGVFGLKNYERYEQNKNNREITFINANIIKIRELIQKAQQPITIYFSNVIEYLTKEELTELKNIITKMPPETTIYDSTNEQKSKIYFHIQYFNTHTYLIRLDNLLNKIRS